MTETLESAIFSPGDEVLVLLPTESSKMTATWKGPFQIVRKLSDVNYQVNVGARRGLVTYHINLLKRYNRNRVMNIHFKINYRSGASNKNADGMSRV